jgi:preprotein translocase subunit SecG
MGKVKLKKVGYVTANTCGRLTRITAIASAVFFVVGLVGSMIVDGCERREIKASIKTKK